MPRGPITTTINDAIQALRRTAPGFHAGCARPALAELAVVRRFCASRGIKALLLALCCAALTGLAHAAEPFLGVFSNEADGFNIKTLMLDSNGKGFYFAAVAGAPVLWKRNGTTNEFTLTGPFGANQATESFIVRFDPAKREYIILDPKRAEESRPLHHVADEIPPRIRDAIKDFDGTSKPK